MSKSNRKAGKAKKSKPSRKPSTRRPAPRNAPVASSAAAPEQTFPCTVLVSKGGDKLPVQVQDAAHLAKLREEHGATGVEVQS